MTFGESHAMLRVSAPARHQDSADFKWQAGVLSDDELSSFANFEFSLDFATDRGQDSWRGPGKWRLVLDQTGRTPRLGVHVTIMAIMMRAYYEELLEIGSIAAR
jgi:hypothetical protein